MAVRVTEANEVKTYDLTAGKSFPQWASKRDAKGAKNDEEYANRVDLIQDLEFPVASGKVKLSPDGNFLAAVGVYPPQIRVFTLSEMSMRFQRNLDCEVVQFQLLSEDWRKMLFLRADRFLEFHNPNGVHFRTRIPRFGRDFAYDSSSCDVYIGSSCKSVYRLNLELGMFQPPLEVESSGVNCVGMSPFHSLIAMGTESGTVECFDPRSRNRIGLFDLVSHLSPAEPFEISALRHGSDGVSLAVGTSTGQVSMLDLRASTPLFTKDHSNSLPIRAVKFLSGSNKVVSTDPKVIKIWDAKSGKVFTNIEPEAHVNSLCPLPNSGLILAGLERSRVGALFTPALGPAPRWCAHLDAIIEDFDDTEGSAAYDDYKFVSRDELAKLGLTELIGTPLLRAYMHGFYMDVRLYRHAHEIANPYAFEDHRKKVIQSKIESRRASRISVQKKAPVVNKEYASALAAKATTDEDSARIPDDDRFGKLFSNPDFIIDRDSWDYKFYNPSGHNAEKVGNEETKEGSADESDEEGSEMEELQDEAYDSEAGDGEAEVRAIAADEDLTEVIGQDPEARRQRKVRQRLQKSVPLGRMAQVGPTDSASKRVAGGAKEVSFVPADEIARRKRQKTAGLAQQRKGRRKAGT